MSKPRRSIVALCYDFDGTLAPGNMQEHGFLPDVGIDKSKFWEQVAVDAEAHEADNILVYMRNMLEEARHAKKPVGKSDFVSHGRKVKLFAGVEEWFSRVNAYAKDRSLETHHYIISSGIREIIKGTSIAKNFKEIFASSFLYDANGVAVWPALALNYTTKTQYLFRINKGTLAVHDHSVINKFTPREERPVPFSRMIFIGDGETDIPCMRLVTDQGGYAIAVYRPKQKGAQEKAHELISQQRAKFIAPADYSEDGKLDRLVKGIIDDIAAREALGRLGNV